MWKFTFVFILSMTNISLAATQSDYAKEKRWAAQVEDALLDGEAVWLQQDGHKFMTIYTEAVTPNKRTAVIVHGLGIHPDWPQVIQPLRVGLTEHGWNTLSIQVPILANGIEGKEYTGLFPQAAARITASVDYLKSQSLEPVALVAHSMGSRMAGFYLSKQKDIFKQFVAIGMPEGAVAHLPHITTPMLDLYGSADNASVLQSAKARKEAYPTPATYTQQVAEGADHFFNGKDEDLIAHVATWLKQ